MSVSFGDSLVSGSTMGATMVALLNVDVRMSCKLYRIDAVGEEGLTAGRGDCERALVGCGSAGDTGDRGTDGTFATDFDVVIESGVPDDRRNLSGVADDRDFIAADFLATRLPFLAASLDLLGVP
jgi:hypothetical protein